MNLRSGELLGILGDFTPLVSRRSIALLPHEAMLSGFLLTAMLERT